MSSHDGLQVVPDYGSQQPHYEGPIPIPQHSYEAPISVSRDPYEKGAQVGAETHESGNRNSSKKPILGMRRKTFWIVLAVVIVVIVAAVGGGVGGSQANKKKTSSAQPATQSSSSTSPTASRTSASSSASTTPTSSPGPTTNGYTGCPGINGTLYKASSGAKFMQYCDYDIVSSTDLNFNNQSITNFDCCIELCDANNVRTESTGCKAVTYNFAAGDFLICFLKSGTGTLELDSVANDVGNYSVSAVLQ